MKAVLHRYKSVPSCPDEHRLIKYIITPLHHCQVCVIFLLTPWDRVLLDKLTGSQPVKKFSTFYETRTFNTLLKVPATCPNPEPDQFNPCPPHITAFPEDPS